MRNYRKALRIFFDYLDRDWADDVEVGAPVRPRVSEADVLDADDIESLRKASKRPRDTALVEFLADTGARLSMAGSLRLADIHLDGDRAYFTPNPDASGLKGAPQQPCPIIDNKAALRAYIRNAHPQPDNSEAALFHRVRYHTLGEDDGSLTPQHLSRVLMDLAETAGIEKPVNSHNFRHAAISRMYREGYTIQEIQHRVAWNLDTDMWDQFVHLSAEEMNEQIYAKAGVVEEDKSVSTERKPCGNRTMVVLPYARFCPMCDESADPEAREFQFEAESDVVDEIASEDEETHRELLRKVHGLVTGHPEVL